MDAPASQRRELDGRGAEAREPVAGGDGVADFYREQAERAKAIRAEQNTFRTLLLSQWVEWGVGYWAGCRSTSSYAGGDPP